MSKTKTTKRQCLTTDRPRNLIVLYGLNDAAKWLGVSRDLLALHATGKWAPRHYMTNRVADIFFDEKTLNKLAASWTGKAQPNA